MRKLLLLAASALVGRGNPPVPAPDVSIPGPANGASRTLQIPLNLAGGRISLSLRDKLKFSLVPGGLVQPAPWAAGDPDRDILFDWSEFTYNGGGLWLNSSQVDMFSVPHAVEATSQAGATKRTGVLVGNGRNRIFDQPSSRRRGTSSTATAGSPRRTTTSARSPGRCAPRSTARCSASCTPESLVHEPNPRSAKITLTAF